MRRMSIMSLPMPRIIAYPSRPLAARPLDRIDDRVRAQCRDNCCQMLNVANFDVDHDLEAIRRTIGNLQIADVAALLSNFRSHAAKIAGFVGDGHIEPADVDGIVVVAPGDIEPALRCLGEALESLAVYRVYRHPLPGGNDAHDAITGQWMAAA